LEEQSAVDELFRVQKRIRKSAHQKNIHEYQPVGNPFRQNNDTSVHVTITKDELYKSQIRLTHRFRYIDSAAPAQKQPSH
jgi:hypothetical protein